MDRRLRLGVLILVMILGQSPGIAAQEAAPANAIQMTAKKYEFNPDTVTVKQGDHVTLVITATDRDHGIKIEGYNIQRYLPKGVPTTLTFTADKSGTFPFACSVVCGLGHHKMKGKLVVQPPGSTAPSTP